MRTGVRAEGPIEIRHSTAETQSVLFAAARQSPSPTINLLHDLGKFWLLWLAIGVVLAARVVGFLWQQRRLRRSGIREIKTMTGEQFERRLAILFRDLGYRVEPTGKRGDFGADLVVTKGKKRTVVQAKRWSKNVGVKAVQEANTARSMYRAEGALVVTSSGFTKAARKLAASAHVELWDEPELVRRLLRVRGKAQPPPAVEPTPVVAETLPGIVAEPVTDVAVCARCGKPISERVRDYCLAHRERFAGLVYCFEHQRAVRS
jgi:restriction system protein